MKTFADRVRAAVSKIPVGSVLTYGEVACRAGNAKAARSVGMILSKNHDPTVPCHRVIRSDGKLGGYNKGALEKLNLLQKEGVRGFNL